MINACISKRKLLRKFGRISDSIVERKQQFSVACLFSGMGGFASGFAKAGFSIFWANDNDEFACKAFRHRFPNVRMIEKSVHDLSVSTDELPPVEVLAAGFPCQSFSQAGSRLGFDDPRGALFFEIPRLIEEFQPEARPSLVVLENVPHLLHGAEGQWFDQVRRTLRRAGYWFRAETCWTVNVKDATDSPQDRERLFMVAASKQRFTRNPFSPPHKIDINDKFSKSIDTFIDRSRRDSEEAYLSPDNRYYKMIEQAMVDGESAANIYQLRRSAVRKVHNHYFATGNRGIIRDNAISRLWWLGKIAFDADPDDPRHFLTILLHRQDVRSALIERPSVSLNPEVLRRIYAVMREYWDGDRELFKRDAFRNWMTGLNHRGGVVMLDALPEDALDELLQEEVSAAIEND